MRLSDHFTSEEFDCHHCGKGGENAHPQLIFALEELRSYLGQPIIVVSGWRCPEHPETVRRPGGMHPTGKAADIKVAGKTVPELYLAAAGISDFYQGGIGIYDSGFVHVDVRGVKARWGQLGGVYVSLLAAWEWLKKQEREA